MEKDFLVYKEELNTKPEVRLQAEINLLTLEKVSHIEVNGCMSMILVIFTKGSNFSDFLNDSLVKALFKKIIHSKRSKVFSI